MSDEYAVIDTTSFIILKTGTCPDEFIYLQADEGQAAISGFAIQELNYAVWDGTAYVFVERTDEQKREFISKYMRKAPFILQLGLTTQQEDDAIEAYYEGYYEGHNNIEEWRAANYGNVYVSALLKSGQNAFQDSQSVISYKEDYIKYNTLTDNSVYQSTDWDSTAYLFMSYIDTDLWVQKILPQPKYTGTIRFSLDIELGGPTVIYPDPDPAIPEDPIEYPEIRGYISYSLDGENWIYASGPSPGQEPDFGTFDLTEYSTAEDARENYIWLSNKGSKVSYRLNLPEKQNIKTVRIYYYYVDPVTFIFRSFYLLENIYDDDIAGGELVTSVFHVQSADGKTTWINNTITIKDSADKIRVKIGMLT